MIKISRSKILNSNNQFSTSKFIFDIDIWFDITNPYCFKSKKKKSHYLLLCQKLNYYHCQSCFYTAQSVLSLAFSWICAQRACCEMSGCLPHIASITARTLYLINNMALKHFSTGGFREGSTVCSFFNLKIVRQGA